MKEGDISEDSRLLPEEDAYYQPYTCIQNPNSLGLAQKNPSQPQSEYGYAIDPKVSKQCQKNHRQGANTYNTNRRRNHR